MAWVYWNKHYYQEYFSEDFLDSVLILCDIALSYDNQVADAYIVRGNYYRANGISDKAVEEFDKALKYFKKYIAILETFPEESRETGSEHRIGYAFWQNGYRKEAEYYLNKQMEHCHSLIKFGRSHSQLLLSYYDIAAIYAFRGERDKAYENLKIFNQRQMMPLWAVTLIKTDPLFNSIRDEPEFQQIAREIEAKFQAEHERVRKWLEEQGI